MSPEPLIDGRGGDAARWQRSLRGTCAALVLLSALPAGSQPGATGLRQALSAIAAGDDNDQRRAAITQQLQAAGIPFDLQTFTDPRAGSGVNVVVRLPGPGARPILVGAHYDRVSVGRGVVDNGASCAVLLELLANLRAAPLAKHPLTVVFFDLEERGLAGSRAYFQRIAVDNRPLYAVNVDVFGYGDSLFVTASRPPGALLAALKGAAGEAGLPVRDVAAERYPGSDHLSMIAAGVETLGVALVDAADVDAILTMGVPNAAQPGSGPKVMTIIHSTRDTMEAARPDEIARALPVVERMLRVVDRSN